ncbi:ABC-F family ATP-binding cassette domain-containing protein [soil metagenome]
MPLLTATNLKLNYGDRVILDGVSISLEPGERIGIVGRNGCGKSSLMKVLAGITPADGGTVAMAKGSRAGYLHQDPKFDPGETLRGAAESAFDELHRLHQQLDEVFEKMAHAGDDGEVLERLLKTQETLEERMHAAGGYAIDHKIEAVLHGIGFTDAQFSIPITGLSGGQKGRLALARLLLENPDVLLLDEPTNHLDIEGRLWLEEFLSHEFKGAVILVSHDRYLLDNVVKRIIEVEQARLIDYPGNYNAFREIRAQRRLTQARAFQNEQTKFKSEEAFIRRYGAGQRAKQAQGRLSRLTRAKEESTLERPMEMEAFRLVLPKAERTGDIVASARGVSKSYPADDGSMKVLFKDLDLSIARGERWGIIGPNGAGKSTLVRCLLGEQQVDEGVVKLGSAVKPGYYRQSHDHVESDLSIWQYLQRVILKEAPGSGGSEQQARNLAGAFLFGGDEQEKQMGMLSGGERSRAVLAGLLASAKNVLVLDEPTNHLDIPSAERLEDALGAPDPESDDDTGYDGALILISHDRALIDATCENLLIFDGKGGVKAFGGNYTAWHDKQLALKRAEAREEADLKKKREDGEKQRNVAEQRKKEVAAANAKGFSQQPQRGGANASGNAGGGGGAAGKGNQSGGSSAPGGGSARTNTNGNAPLTNKQRLAQSALGRLATPEIEQRIAKIEQRIAEIDAALADTAVWRDPQKCEKLGNERQVLAEELPNLEMEYLSRG